MPYDLRTNDISKLNERLEAIDTEINNIDYEIEKLENEADKSIYNLNLIYNGKIYSLPELLDEVSAIKYLGDFGYDTSTYIENNDLFKKDMEKVKDKIIDDFRNTAYDKRFHDELEEYDNKAKFNKEFIEKVKNDKISPNGEKPIAPSDTFQEWMDEVYYRINSYKQYYDMHENRIKQLDELNKKKIDYTNEYIRTTDHISDG